jgi:hypothetical protein
MSKYIVVHSHEYGISTFIVESEKSPTVRQLIRCLDLNFEPDKSEQIQVDAIADLTPTVLDWQDGDDQEFEYA